MILKITDSTDNTETIVKVMMVEREENSSEFKVWDYCDNMATIYAKDELDAKYCIQKLYSNNRAEINAEIEWDNE